MAEPLGGHNCKIVTAIAIAAELLGEVRGNLNTLTLEKECEPLLVGFLANEDPAAEKYAEFTAKTTREK
jgi:methylenetetrahydrofolate dehydrogenase (NAD+)